MQQLKKPKSIEDKKTNLQPVGQKVEAPKVDEILGDLNKAAAQIEKDNLDTEFRRRAAQHKKQLEDAAQRERERQKRKSRAARQCGCW